MVLVSHRLLQISQRFQVLRGGRPEGGLPHQLLRERRIDQTKTKNTSCTLSPWSTNMLVDEGVGFSKSHFLCYTLKHLSILLFPVIDDDSLSVS